MSDLKRTAQRPKTAALSEDVQILAMRALAILAETKGPKSSQLSERIHAMSDDFRLGDPSDARRAIDRVLADGVSINDTIDFVLPEIARHLGERWFADDISFVDVSIGTARLQETVRALRQRERGWPMAVGRDRRVLMIIPAPEEHTLGAIIATDQLRRRGIMVDLSVAEKRREVAARLEANRYKMIAISASGIRTVAAVKELVDTVRRHALQFVPIALGGALADADDRLKDRVNVDIISNDICASAKRCGLLPTETIISDEIGSLKR